MKLFEPDAPWPTAASFVSVFKLYPQFMRHGSDADLQKIFQWLGRHRIALAVEVGMISPRPDCRATEGFDADQSAIAERVRRLGGDLQYVAADEPLYYGHHNKKGDERLPPCQIAIPELANLVASSARD